MKIFLFLIAFAAAWVFALLWLMRRIHYRIGAKDLKIVLLGFCVRRIPLLLIEGVSKREPKGFAEYWLSTTKPKHRLLTIRLSKGLRRHICITPRNRYVFLADLKGAIRRVNPQASFAQAKAGAPPMDSSFDLEETEFVERASSKTTD